MDPSKIQAMLDWPVPADAKGLRGFLGLTGYYRKFIKGYGTIAKPLTELTKKGSFLWTPATEAAFATIKTAMTTAPVLKLPDFSLPFIVETDASYYGLGTVLIQDKHPLAFISKALGVKNLGLSIYEKEMLAILLAVSKWRSYLLHTTFIIRTDHKSLKFLLEQKVSTPLQHRYLTKLLGFDYKIEYKKGADNGVADALLRANALPGECRMAMATTLQPMWVGEILQSYQGDAEVQDVITELVTFPYNVSFYSYRDGLLRFKGKLVVGNTLNLRTQILEYMHSSSVGGYSGITATYQRVAAHFWWNGMRQQVQRLVRECHICQISKHEHVYSPGLLQPLPVPTQPWTYISMDFIEQLPLSAKRDTIWVIVDRFTKYSHFVALSHPFSASSLATLFLDTIYKLHGLPQSVVSDRDKIFTSQFWTHLFKLLGIQ